MLFPFSEGFYNENDLILYPYFSFSNCGSLYSFVGDPPRYTAEKVVIDAANDDCSDAGLTAEDLLQLTIDAMDAYWHKVPTSSLRFEKGTVRDFSNGSVTLSNFLTARGEANKIIVSCSTVGFEATTLGLGTIGSVGDVAAGHSTSVTIPQLPLLLKTKRKRSSLTKLDMRLDFLILMIPLR